MCQNYSETLQTIHFRKNSAHMQESNLQNLIFYQWLQVYTIQLCRKAYLRDTPLWIVYRHQRAYDCTPFRAGPSKLGHSFGWNHFHSILEVLIRCGRTFLCCVINMLLMNYLTLCKFQKWCDYEEYGGIIEIQKENRKYKEILRTKRSILKRKTKRMTF